MSRREQAKAERRDRIVAAARDLIRETGDAGLSMRAIAARAGVALTTPYSLFGSKRAIIVALLDDVRDFHDRFARVPADDPIARIFAAIEFSLAYLADDPSFYRTLWSEALRFDGGDLRDDLQSPERDAFWHALLADARDAGALLPGLAIDPLLRALDAVYVATMLAWVLGAIQTERLGARIGYGYTLALRGAATDAHRAALEQRLRDFQQMLDRARESAAAA